MADEQAAPGDGPTVLADLALAAQFLTRLPISAPRSGAAALAGAMRMFPVVGAGVGLLGGVVFLIGDALDLGPWVSAILALTATIVLTGALHEDALADVVDGFGGGRDRDAKLAIMRDSQIGAYGVLALVLSVALRIAVLATLGDPDLVMAVLISAAAASRTVMPVVMHVLEPARPDGVGAGAGAVERDTVIWAAVLGVVVAFALLYMATAIIATVAVGLALWGGIQLARRQIGGFTGDVVGAIGQISEIVFIVACLAIV